MKIQSECSINEALVLCLFILIHPQYVNISSLYSASLFMLSSIVLSLKLFNQSQKLNNFNLKTILALSLCFASLPVLKSQYFTSPLNVDVSKYLLS